MKYGAVWKFSRRPVDCDVILGSGQPRIFGKIKETKSVCLLLSMITNLCTRPENMSFFFCFKRMFNLSSLTKRCRLMMFSLHFFQASPLDLTGTMCPV